MRFDKFIPRIVILLCCLLTNLVGILGASSCGKRQYKSDFLSGGCARCPDILQKCDEQEHDDAIRCFKACRHGQPMVTSPPTLDYAPTSETAEVRIHTKVRTKPSELHTKTGGSTSKISKSFATFKSSLGIPTSNYGSNGDHSGHKDIAGIIIGVIALVAVGLLAGVSIVTCLKRRTEDTSAEPSTAYAPVTLDSKSNSDESLELETLTKTVNVQLDFDETSLDLASISYECLAAMKVSQV